LADIDPNFTPELWERHWNVLKKVGGLTFQTRHRNKFGEIHPVEITANYIEFRGRAFNCAFVRDVSERVRAMEDLRQSRQSLLAHIENTPLAVIEMDLAGCVKGWNPAAQRIFGYTQIEVIGKKLIEIVVPEHLRPQILEVSKALYKGEGGRFHTNENLTKDGRAIICEWYNSLLMDHEGKPLGVTVLAQDVTERVRAVELLKESEERYALAMRGANDGLWDWNLLTNEIHFSPRWKSLIGYLEHEVGTDPEEWLGRIHPADQERVKAAVASHFDVLTTHFENEFRMLHKDGHYRWMLCRGLALVDSDGRTYRMAGSMSDITVRRAIEEQLRRDVFRDPLTGLANRALFMDRLGMAIRRLNRSEDYLFAVLFMDLDRFKLVNDSLGHLAGDQLLIAIARRLERCVRPADTVARLGGDEFAILVDDVRDVSDATRVAARIQKELALPFTLSGHEVFTSGSIGIAISTSGYEHPEDLLRDADNAMYQAKSKGKARHEMFDKTMHTRAITRLQLESDLRRAIENREFEIHYQPIVSLVTGRITGFEALIRWRHPQRGLIPPGDFIPIAEETGFIVPIGAWVLREACLQMREWQDDLHLDPKVSITVNVSGKQFSQPDLVDFIKRTLAETGMSVHGIRLEITESAIMDNVASATIMLAQLKEMAIQLYMDDFGTGYSSLSYLHRFPLDTLKVDRAFTGNMETDQESFEIVRTIVRLAHNLSMDVVAEGVENETQLKMLRELNCQYGQGFYFSRPLPKENIAELIKSQSTW
ncbi:EAL domain-containing protein, partial [Candidatus Sumerlaeota bacterium]|nr:EAL domain-containing protein [Candidatus Sumerlaeota bacterium]